MCGVSWLAGVRVVDGVTYDDTTAYYYLSPSDSHGRDIEAKSDLFFSR